MRRYRGLKINSLKLTLDNPPGSTPPELRKARKERRKRRMRLRKLRGWH